MSGSVQVIPVSCNERDVMRFLQMAYSVYRDDPNWVAPLLMDIKKVFLPENPLFEHAEMQLWMAVRDGKDVGRIAGILDTAYNRFQNEKTVFYGFYECANDPEASRLLFEAVSAWGKSKGMNKVMGPMNPTTNDECGLLVEGLDSPPVFMMTYNPDYYIALTEASGFVKAKDLVAFHIDLKDCPLDRLGKIADRVKKRLPEIKLRPVRKKTLEADLAKVKEVYNSAWEANWGFVPMTDKEIDFMAARLKPLLMEGLVWLAETQTETVGFLLAMPDYNVALKPLRGKLLTPSLLVALPYLLGWKIPKMARVITLGMKASYREKGLEAAMLTEGLKVGFNAGLTAAEASWILEDNVLMCRVIETIGGKIYKRYRIYERAIPA